MKSLRRQMKSPTQSTPAGCFIGVIALFPMAICVLGGYGLYRWWALPVLGRHFDQRFWVLVAALLLGASAAAGLLWLARKVGRATDYCGYDAKDPDEPKLKF